MRQSVFILPIFEILIPILLVKIAKYHLTKNFQNITFCLWNNFLKQRVMIVLKNSNCHRKVVGRAAECHHPQREIEKLMKE